MIEDGSALPEPRMRRPLTWPGILLICAAIALLTYMGWLAQNAFGGQEVESAHSHKITMRVYNLAVSVKGDATKLKPADRAWMRELTTGHEQEAIEKMYKNYQPEARPYERE